MLASASDLDSAKLAACNLASLLTGKETTKGGFVVLLWHSSPPSDESRKEENSGVRRAGKEWCSAPRSLNTYQTSLVGLVKEIRVT